MDLIDRYLFEVGRYLPANQRKDILAELRSTIEDTLEARSHGEPGEEDVVAVLQEIGPPKEVAASYYSEGQYLIGPELYPIFTLVLGIVLVTVIAVQLFALGVAYFFSIEARPTPDMLWNVLGSLPAALGSVVIVFAVLQRLNVRPEPKEEVFDPHRLPAVEEAEPVSRGEQVFSTIVDVIILTWLVYFASNGGFSGEGGFFSNPVIREYLPWLILSTVLGILVDIVLLWQGRWRVWTRLAKIGVEAFTLVLFGLLVQGHNEWLANVGVVGFLDWLPHLTGIPDFDSQLVGMVFFGMFFTVAFIITAIELVVQVSRLVRNLAHARGMKKLGTVGVGSLD
jgi:hypothetical protein